MMTSSSPENYEEDARQAAIDVEDLFESTSELRNDNLAAMVALFDPEEVHLGESLEGCFGDDFTVQHLRRIQLRYERDPPFEYEMEDARDRFADRSHEPYFAVKSISPKCVTADRSNAATSGASLMLEVKILMNLEKHPHICQVYGLSASGPMASFGSDHLEDNFFMIIDAISETLPDRLRAWKERKCYEGQRFDDLASRQQRLTQRLEVALEITSAMTFLANRHLVYFLHPEKVGFDVRYKRIKLFQFGSVRESGRSPYFVYEVQDMRKRMYLAPEVFRENEEEPVTCSADVYALGMLIWEMMTLARPLETLSKEDHLRDVVNGRTRPQLNRSWPNDLRSLMEDCWAQPSSKRPTMKQAYDRLEGCLLFQDFNGIDSTENHSRNVIESTPPASSSTAAATKSRKIRYQRNAPAIEEGDEGESKSVKSSGSKGSLGKYRRERNRKSLHEDIRQRRDKMRQSDHKSVGDDHDTRRSSHGDKKSSRNISRKSKSQSPTRSRLSGSSHDGKSPELRRRERKDSGKSHRRSRSQDKNPLTSKGSGGENSKSSLLRRVKPGAEPPKLTRRKSYDPSLNRGNESFNGFSSTDNSDRTRSSRTAENPEDGGSGTATTYRRRRSPQRRDDGDHKKSGRRPRSKSSSGDQHATRGKMHESFNGFTGKGFHPDGSERSRSSKDNPDVVADGPATTYRRRRSPPRDGGEDNNNNNSNKPKRRSRSKSGDQHFRLHESASSISTSRHRKPSSVRDVSSRGVQRTKSDEVGRFDKEDQPKPLSRRLSRNRSSDGTSSPGSLQRSPGSLQRSPGALRSGESRRRIGRSKSGDVERMQATSIISPTEKKD